MPSSTDGRRSGSGCAGLATSSRSRLTMRRARCRGSCARLPTTNAGGDWRSSRSSERAGLPVRMATARRCGARWSFRLIRSSRARARCGERVSTIVFFPEGAFGPTNNCVGIGDVLRSRGHRVVFVVEESFAGTLEAKGFEERLMRLGPPPAEPEEPGQFWKDFIRDTAPVFRQSTLEQLGTFIAPTWQALIDGARYVDERLG